METKENKMKKAAAKRRAKARSAAAIAEENHGRKWAFIIAGALILALVAFVSGIRIGRTISELKYRPHIASMDKMDKGKEEKKSSSLDRGELPAEQFPEARKEESFPAEYTDKVIGKKGPGNKEQAAEEKTVRAAEEILASASEKGKGAIGKTRYTLQVAAFNNSEEARHMVNQLKNKGYTAYQITGSAAAKGTWYRVRVGAFSSLQEARQFALRFEKKEKIKTVITAVQEE